MAKRATQRLDPKKLTKLPAGMYADGNGLNLRVTPTGARSWMLRYMHNGASHNMGLGPYPLVSLKEAREKSAEWRKQKLAGVDPLTERRNQRAAQQLEDAKKTTLQAFTEQFLTMKRSEWKDEGREWEKTIKRYVYPVIGDMPLPLVDMKAILKVLNQPVANSTLWLARSETARRTQQRLEKILSAATVQELRIGPNPARWDGNLEHAGLPNKPRVTRHHPMLPYADLPAFLTLLARRRGSSANAMRFCILTATRTGEVTGARWDEIDRGNKMWSIPWFRIKKRKQEDGPHNIPLSPQALAIIDEQARKRKPDAVYVFPGQKHNRPLGRMALENVLERMGRKDITPHGFRSTFKTWAAEQTDTQQFIVEAAMSHTKGCKLEQAYNRGEMLQKRTALMHAWADFSVPPPRLRLVSGE